MKKISEEKKAILTNLAQAFLKASELGQSEDSITVVFDEKTKDIIVPTARDFSMLLDDVDKDKVMEETGLEEDDDEYDYE